MRLVVEVKEIRGRCAAYEGGERLIIEDFKINCRESDDICIHALAPILHYITALKEGISPVKLGLSKDERIAYIQCPDCGSPYTNGGTAIFEVKIGHEV